MGGIAKGLARAIGGGPSGGSSNTQRSGVWWRRNQPNTLTGGATSQAPAPVAEVAQSVALPEGTPTAPQAGATGTMGAGGTKKGTSARRRGRLETLLTEMGGSIERFGD